MSSRKIHLRTQRKRHHNERTSEPNISPSLDGGYGWVIVVSSFICNMIVDGISNSFGIFIMSFSNTFQEDKGKVALASSVNVGMHLLVGPLVGALCKRYSCRAVCIAGSILCTIGFFLSIFATNTLLFTLLYGFLGGTGCGMIYISTVILVSYYFELRRSLAVGISICGSGFGTFLFAPLSEILLREFAWQGTHLIFAGFTLNCLVFSLLLLPLEYFQTKPSEQKLTCQVSENADIKPKPFRVKRLQVQYRKNVALSSVLENYNAQEEKADEVKDNNIQVSVDKDQLVESTSRAVTDERDTTSEQGVSLHPSCDTVVERDTLKDSHTETTNLSEPLKNKTIIPTIKTEHVHELDLQTQYLRKKEILKILLFTRIVMKKDYMSGSKLPLFSRKILHEMKSLREMRDLHDLEYEELDFYEIKKSKSEDLTLLQHYLSHVQLNLGESLPSDLHHYAYIVNNVGVSMNNQHQEVNPDCTDYANSVEHQHNAENSSPYDEINTQQVEDDTNVVFAASTRNVKSLPVLDHIDTEEDPCLRETQSIQALGHRTNVEQSEHGRFVSNLFTTNNNNDTTKHNHWTDEDFETTNSDYSFPSHKSLTEGKLKFIGIEDENENKTVSDKRNSSIDGAWWNSSSSVRKDMYYTGSIFNLKEYQEEADDEEYRKRNTVEVSLLQDMWDRELLSNPIFIVFILTNVFLLAGYYIPYVFLVDTAKSRDVDASRASLLMSIIGLSNMFGRIFFGFLDNWKLMDSLFLNNISLITTALSILWFPYCSHFIEYVLACIVFGFSQACVVCLTTTLLVQLFTLDKLTNSFGMLQMFRGLAIMLGFACAGFVFKKTNSYYCIFWLTAGFYLISIALGFLMQCLWRPDSTTYQKVACRPEPPAKVDDKSHENTDSNEESVDHLLMEMVTSL